MSFPTFSSIFGRGADNNGQPRNTAEDIPSRTSLQIRPEIPPEHLGLRVVYQSDRAEIDIIAVHGIGANPLYTWRTAGQNGQDGVDWLKDSTMLQNSIPQARIMRFGYQSQWFGKDAVTTSVSTVANSLREDLETHRKNCPDRPIIFIGHCFGGLVIEKALTLAKLHDSSVVSSTKGIIFLGTPHRGTGDITSSGLMLRLIASAPELHIESAVLKNVEQSSEVLKNLHTEFLIVYKNKVQICCFFEQKSTEVGVIINERGYREFVVDEASSCIYGYSTRGLPLDHFRMSKFTGPDDGNYHAVRNEILRMIGTLNESKIQGTPTEQRRSEERLLPAGRPYYGGSTFSGTNSGSRINQIGNVGGDFSTG